MAGPGQPKTGGRQKGTPNKATAHHKALLAELEADGKDPMAFFCSVMRNEAAPYEERKYAATQLLPFFHPKLASIEARSGGQTHEERLERLLRLAVEDDDTDQVPAVERQH